MPLAILKKVLAHDDSLIGKAAVTFLVRAGGAIAAFGMNVIIARLLGAAEAGIFFLSLTLIMAASTISRFGMDNTLMRFVSPLWEHGDYGKALGVSLQGIGIACVVSIVVALSGYLLAEWLAVHVFNDLGLIAVIRVMSFVVLPFTLIWLVSGLFKAVRLPAMAGFIEAAAVPLIVGLGLSVIFISGITATAATATWVYFSASVITAGLGLALFFNRIPKTEKPALVRIKKLTDSAYPLLWMDILNFAIMWSSSLFLGYYENSESVALYNVAHRTAGLIAFILIVFNSITAPRYAALNVQGKPLEMERLAIKTTTLMTWLSLPLLLAVLFFPEAILSIFGKEFVGAVVLFQIIAVGQFVNVLTGSVGYLLIMSGHERLMRNNVMFVAGLSLILNVLLIEKFGALGAALSTAICLATQNLIAAWFVYNRLGICTIPGCHVLRKLRHV